MDADADDKPEYFLHGLRCNFVILNCTRPSPRPSLGNQFYNAGISVFKLSIPPYPPFPQRYFPFVYNKLLRNLKRLLKSLSVSLKVDCSHRVIEKRRRDRINNSLLQLSKLVPVEKFNKKNSGKLEKAEILEVTVHYLTQQQQLKKENGPSTENSNGKIQGQCFFSHRDQHVCAYVTCLIPSAV